MKCVLFYEAAADFVPNVPAHVDRWLVQGQVQDQGQDLRRLKTAVLLPALIGAGESAATWFGL